MNSDKVAGSPTAGKREWGSGDLALLAILLLAMAFRLDGISFGLPAMNDPDELMFELGAVRMLSGHTLNPGWFGHPGTTTIYLLAVLDMAVFGFGRMMGWFPSAKAFATTIYADPTWVILPGRIAMALFSVWCVWLTYRLGRELFDRRVGLAAAGLLAVDPVHVLWSQVIRTDVMASCFMLLCMLAALRIAREGQRRDTVVAAIWLALAIATKWPFAIAALSVAGAAGLRWLSGRAGLRTELGRFALFGGLAIIFLFLVSPYLLLDHDTVLRNIQGEAQTKHLGATGGGPLWNAWWYLSGPLWAGLGAVGAILAAWGLALFAKRHEPLAIIGPVVAAFFGVICVQHLIWDRWILPLLPLLSVAAGFALTMVLQRVSARWQASSAALAMAALSAVLVAQPVYRTILNGVERKHDTRQLATAWVQAHVPPNSAILVEHFGFDLLKGPWRLIFPLGTRGCVDARDILQNKVQYSAVESARGGQSNVDYGTLDPAKRNTCHIDYAILTQYDRYAAEKDRFPAQFAAYRELLARGRIVATISPVDGLAGGPTVRIVAFRR